MHQDFQEHQANRDQPASKENQVVQESMVKREIEDYKAIQGHLVSLAYRAHLARQEVLDHQANKATLDHQVSRETLDHLDRQAYKEHQEIKVLLVLRDLWAFEEILDQLVK